jgi:penicillin amidase
LYGVVSCSKRSRLYVYASVCIWTAACTGEISPATPVVDDTQLKLEESATEQFKLPGYPNAIEIKRDATGVPHISARTEREGYGALCYAIATDRLFQLDFLRRVAQGRVAELVGAGPDDSVLKADRLARVINIPKLANDRFSELSKSSQELMTACSTGINLVIERAIEKNTLPLEFQGLGYQPAKWQPQDSLAISMGVAMNLDTGIYLTKIQISAISAIISQDVAAALVPLPPALSMFDKQGKLNPPKQFVTGPGKGNRKKPSKLVDSPRLERGWRAPQRQSTGLGEGAGPESNNYAIDGQLTKSGRPLLANDPHLPLTTPSLAYTAQLQVDSDENGKRMNVEGVTFPGFPTFVSARTDTTSWGVTFMLLDNVDLYLEQIKDAEGGGKEALIDGDWTPVGIRSETIQIAGAPAQTMEVYDTKHGPVLNAAIPELNGFGPVALKSTTAQPEWSIEGLINLPRTSTWADFKKSARSSGIGFNFLFSDETGKSGRIGYQASGLVPLRESADNAFVVVPGFDGNHEWTGYAKPGELPSAYDPSSHALATGNNRIVPDDYAPEGRPIYLSNYFDTPWRAQRLYTRLLKGSPTFNVTDFASIQLDTFSVLNLPLRDTLVKALEPSDDPTANAALNALQKWDGNANANSKGAAVYETLLFVLLRDTVIGAFGEYAADLYPGYASSVFVTQQQQALRDLLESPRAPFFGATDDPGAPAARDQAVRVAFGQAVELLRKTLGDDVAKWTWGGIHTLTYNHPLAGLDPRFDLGTFAANGDASTPWIGGFFLHSGLLALPPEAGGLRAAFAQDALQVVRAIWEPSNKKRSLLTLSTGQSGDPRSPHYSDQAKPWRNGKHLQLPYFQ